MNKPFQVSHYCTFCRCRFPDVPPQIDEMMANAQRVARELREAREELRDLKAMKGHKK